MGCWWSKCCRSGATLSKPQPTAVQAPASTASAVAMEEKDETNDVAINLTHSPNSQGVAAPSSHASTPQGKVDILEEKDGNFEIPQRSSSETASLRDATSRDQDARKRLDKVHRRGRLQPSDSYSGAGSSAFENSDSSSSSSSQLSPLSEQSPAPESSVEMISERDARLAKTARSGHRKREGPFGSTNRHKGRIFDSNSSLNMTRGTDGEIMEESNGGGSDSTIGAKEKASSSATAGHSSAQIKLSRIPHVDPLVPSTSLNRIPSRNQLPKVQESTEESDQQPLEGCPFRRNTRSALELLQDRTDVELTSLGSLNSPSHSNSASDSNPEDAFPTHPSEDMTRFRFPIATHLDRSSALQSHHAARTQSPASSTLLTSPSPFSTTEEMPNKAHVIVHRPKAMMSTPPFQKAHSFHRSHPITTQEIDLADTHSESPQAVETAHSVPNFSVPGEGMEASANGSTSANHANGGGRTHSPLTNLKIPLFRSASSPANLSPISFHHEESEFYDSQEEDDEIDDDESFGFGHHSIQVIEPPGTRHLPSIGKMEQEASVREVLESSQSSMVVRGISAEALAAQVAQVDEWRDSPSVGAPHPSLGASLTISAPSRSSSDRLENQESVMTQRIPKPRKARRYLAPVATTNAHVMMVDDLLPNPIQLVEEEASNCSDESILNGLEFGPIPLTQRRSMLLDRPLNTLIAPLQSKASPLEATPNEKKRLRSQERPTLLPSPFINNASHAQHSSSQLQLSKLEATEDDFLEPPLKRVSSAAYDLSVPSKLSALVDTSMVILNRHYYPMCDRGDEPTGGELDTVADSLPEDFSSEWSDEWAQSITEEVIAEADEHPIPWYDEPSFRPRLTQHTDGHELMYYDDEDWFGGEGADWLMDTEKAKDKSFTGTYEFNLPTPVEAAKEAQRHSVSDLFQVYRAYFYWDIDIPVIFRRNARYRYPTRNAPHSLASLSPASRSRATQHFTRYAKRAQPRDEAKDQ